MKEEENQKTMGGVEGGQRIEENVAEAKRRFRLMEAFAIVVQAIITVVWFLRGTPRLQIAMPVLSLIVLAIGLIGFAAGYRAVYLLKIAPLFNGVEESDEGSEEAGDW